VNEIENIISKLEKQRASIDRAIAALREIDTPNQIEAVTSQQAQTKSGQKRQLSPKVRQRIVEATKRRSAAKRAAEVSSNSI
jgi:hypothetical protein